MCWLVTLEMVLPSSYFIGESNKNYLVHRDSPKKFGGMSGPCLAGCYINGTVVGPFEEEEEGTGIASDVVKVQGEDPATPGLLP